MKCPKPNCNHPKDFTEDELKIHLEKSHKQKIHTKKSEQDYTKTMLPFGKDDRVAIVCKNRCVYLACKIHGAMLAYKDKIYRCEVCGFSVTCG
jgi:hypothetical protein